MKMCKGCQVGKQVARIFFCISIWSCWKLGHLLLLLLKKLWMQERDRRTKISLRRALKPPLDAQTAGSSSPSARPQKRSRNLRACWRDLGSTRAAWRAWQLESSAGRTAPWRNSLPGGGWLFLQAHGVKCINISGGEKSDWLKYIQINSGAREYCIVTYGLIDGLHAEVFYQRLARSLPSTVRLSRKERRKMTLTMSFLPALPRPFRVTLRLVKIS